MAFVFGANASGDVSVSIASETWATGECVIVEMASARGYLKREEALRLHAQLGAALEKLGCTPVSVEVSDESEEGVPS